MTGFYDKPVDVPAENSANCKPFRGCCLPNLGSSWCLAFSTDVWVVCCSSKTGRRIGEESSRSDRESSSGGSSIASAIVEIATDLAQNCSVPLVSEAATLMSHIVKLVSDSQDNMRGIEKRLARCRSIIVLLKSAADVVGKVRG